MCFLISTLQFLTMKEKYINMLGDEIAIPWSIKQGVRNANCLNCFTQIQEKLLELRPVYEQKYNVLPKFKAGLHFTMATLWQVSWVW